MKVIKRNGKEVYYDKSKIETAISKANAEVEPKQRATKAQITKIVDYIASNRCILAIGSDTCASIQYFIDNDCAAVATAPSEIAERLSELQDTPALLGIYAEKAWQSGKAHHERSVMQENLLADLKNAMGE